MKFGKTLIGALLVGILVLAPSAYGISISVYGDTGGFTENIHAGARDSVYGSAMIGPGSFSNSIRGSGNLKESHWVSNSAGSSAGVGVDIRKAESYDYGYISLRALDLSGRHLNTRLSRLARLWMS